jgi:hypothetical protein
VVLVLVQIVRAVALWVKAILVIVGAVAVVVEAVVVEMVEAAVVEMVVVEMVEVLSTNRVRPTLLLPFSSLKYSVLLAFNPI